MIDIKDTIALSDNNEYVVVSKANYNDEVYYYLIDKNDSGNIMFCYQDNNQMVELTDKDLIVKLLPLFLEASKNELKDIIEASH